MKFNLEKTLTEVRATDLSYSPSCLLRGPILEYTQCVMSGEIMGQANNQQMITPK